jgi:hypothetical protein
MAWNELFASVTGLASLSPSQGSLSSASVYQFVNNTIKDEGK